MMEVDEAFENLEKRLKKSIEESVGGEKLYRTVLRALFEFDYEIGIGRLFSRNHLMDVNLEKVTDLIRDTGIFIAEFYEVIDATLKMDTVKELRKDIRNEYGFLNYDFERICRLLNRDKAKRYELASRVLGLTFGIYIQKAADVTYRKVCRLELRNYIEKSDIEEPYKSEILKYSLLYLKYKKKCAEAIKNHIKELDATDALKYEGLIAYGLLRKNTDNIRKKKQPIDKMAAKALTVILEHTYSSAWTTDDEKKNQASYFINGDYANWIDYLDYEGIIG